VVKRTRDDLVAVLVEVQADDFGGVPLHQHHAIQDDAVNDMPLQKMTRGRTRDTITAAVAHSPAG
jgi:hypothetical protein